MALRLLLSYRAAEVPYSTLVKFLPRFACRWEKPARHHNPLLSAAERTSLFGIFTGTLLWQDVGLLPPTTISRIGYFPACYTTYPYKPRKLRITQAYQPNHSRAHFRSGQRESNPLLKPIPHVSGPEFFSVKSAGLCIRPPGSLPTFTVWSTCAPTCFALRGLRLATSNTDRFHVHNL